MLITSSLETPNSPAKSCTRSLLKPAPPHPYGHPASDSDLVPESRLPDLYRQFHPPQSSHDPPQNQARRLTDQEPRLYRVPEAAELPYSNCCSKHRVPQ